MVNINGNITTKELAHLSIYNRGFAYGDAVFETIKVHQNKIFFLEDHYFRLMASMRILRMEIPMNFTLEFIETQILNLIEANGLSKATVRVKFMVNRKEGGFYTPISNDIEYVILAEKLDHNLYILNQGNYKIDLFKDFFVSPGLISTLKSNNRIISVVGSIYAKENNLDNCLILNTDKNIVEALNANIFLVNNKTVKTPPLQDGCIKGVMRKQIIEIVKSMSDFILEEASVSPFELQKADELFITNVISGIQAITHYRKKTYTKTVSKEILNQLNLKIS